MGLSSAPSSPCKLRLKYTFERETRVLGIASTIEFAALAARLRELTGGIGRDAELRLTYVDNEGDTLSIQCDDDLRECMDYCAARSLLSLKVTVAYHELAKSPSSLPVIATPATPVPPVGAARLPDGGILPPITPTKLQRLTLAELEDIQKALRSKQQQVDEAVGRLRATHPIVPEPPGPPHDDGEPDADRARPKKKKRFQWVRGRLLGTGANSKVYIGLNQHTAELFAVKQILAMERDSASYKDLEREINLMKQLDHPNIVRYLGAEKRGQYFNIFLECVSGGSIASMLQVFGMFHEKVTKLYTRQILEGLAYLHSNGVVHRDIKGGNILVDNLGTVKLADFGCSKRWTDDSADDKKLLKGTTLWMAPEVVRGNAYSAASDIWSVGCTIIEMTTGRPPWAEVGFSNEMQALYHIGRTNAHPRLPQALSFAGAEFLTFCFASEPKQRLSSHTLLAHPWLHTEDPSLSASSSPRPPYNLDESMCGTEHDYQSSVVTRTTESTSFTLDHSQAVQVAVNFRQHEPSLSRHSSLRSQHFSPPRSSRPSTRASPRAASRFFESSPKRIDLDARTFESELLACRRQPAPTRRRCSSSTDLHHSIKSQLEGEMSRTFHAQPVSDGEDALPHSMSARSAPGFSSPPGHVDEEDDDEHDMCDEQPRVVNAFTGLDGPSQTGFLDTLGTGLDESIRTERSAGASVATSRATSPFLEPQFTTLSAKPQRKRNQAQRCRQPPPVSRRILQLAQPSPAHSPVRRTRKGKTVEFLSISLESASSKP